MTWFAIQTKPQTELKAKESLQRMGITIECPMVVEIRARRRRNSLIRVEVGKPMFQGYVFIEAEYIPHWITKEDWFVRPLPSRKDPRHIPGELVESALSMSGKITVNEWKQVQRFARGDTVRRKGDTSGLTGKVISAEHDKLIVLFNMLGESKLRFTQDQVEAA